MIDYPLEEVEQKMLGRRIKTMRKPRDLKSKRMQLIQLSVKGFKSIHPDYGQVIDFGDVTVLLGPNGAGKSNLVSFLKMLNFISREELQIFIGKQGGADALLHYGSKHTDAIEFCLILKPIPVNECHSSNFI